MGGLDGLEPICAERGEHAAEAHNQVAGAADMHSIHIASVETHSYYGFASAASAVSVASTLAAALIFVPRAAAGTRTHQSDSKSNILFA